MKIKELTLRNIRSYESETITFPPGSVLLSGDIGAGKSTILHAVEFALFGARRDLSSDALLRKGSSVGEINLKMVLAGKEVEVRRKLKRTSQGVAQETGELVVSGERMELTTTELKAKIISMLGYPQELLTKSKSLIFRYTVYTPQEDMKQIIYDSPEGRVDTLRKVFGIDRYKRIADNAQIFSKKMRDVKRTLEGSVEDLAEKERLLHTKLETERIVHGKRAETIGALEIVRAEKKDKELAVKELEKKEKEAVETKRKADVLDAELRQVVLRRSQNTEEMTRLKDALTKERRELADMGFVEKELPDPDETEKEKRILETRLKTLREKRAGLAERKENITQRLQEQKDKKSRTEESIAGLLSKTIMLSELQETLKDRSMIKEMLREIEDRAKEKEIQLARIKTRQRQSEELKEHISILNTCPTCRQEVPAEHKEKIGAEEEIKIQKLQQEIDSIDEQRKKMLKDAEELRRKTQELEIQELKVTKLQAEAKAFEEKKQELTTIQNMQEELERSRLAVIQEMQGMDERMLQEIEKDLLEKNMLLKEVAEYRLSYNRYKGLQRMLEEKDRRCLLLEEQNEDLKRKVQDINMQKMQLPKVKLDDQDMGAAKKELADVTEHERGLSIRFGEITKELEGLSDVISLIRREVASKKEKKEQAERLAEINDWIEDRFVKLMANMERHVMLKIHEEFEGKFSQWFNILIEDQNINIRLDDSFCPLVEQNGHETSMEYLSGGEKTAVALSYRLALNRTVNDMVDSIKTKDLLILDEPTDGFSSEQLDRVRDVLDEIGISQVIIVSHEPKIESMVQNVVRIEKQGHVSRVI